MPAGFHPTRRDFLAQAAAGVALYSVGDRLALAADAAAPIKVAAVMTAFHHRSHAHVILENFLEPYLFNGQATQPGMQVVSFYSDQYPADDMTRPIS